MYVNSFTFLKNSMYCHLYFNEIWSKKQLPFGFESSRDAARVKNPGGQLPPPPLCCIPDLRMAINKAIARAGPITFLVQSDMIWKNSN